MIIVKSEHVLQPVVCRTASHAARGGPGIVEQLCGFLCAAVQSGVIPRLVNANAPNHNGRRSEEHTSELQSHVNLVCRLLLEKKKKKKKKKISTKKKKNKPNSIKTKYYITQ